MRADRLRDVVDGALDGGQVAARAFAQSRLALEQRLGVERDRRDGVVDVVRDAARHLAERAQPLLLDECVLRLPQRLVALLELARAQLHAVFELVRELLQLLVGLVQRVARRAELAGCAGSPLRRWTAAGSGSAAGRR